MKARRIYADFLVTARGYYRNAAALFFALVFPIILIGIFGLIFAGGTSPPTLYVDNADHNSPASQALMAELNRTGAVSVAIMNVPAQSFDADLKQNQSAAGLLIPEGYAAAVANRTPFNVSLFVNPSDANAAGTAEAAVNAVLTGINLQEANATPRLGFTVGQVGGVTYNYIDYLVPGLIGFSILTSPMFAMVEVVSSYRKEGLFRQLTLTPLTRAEWLSSKILWYTALTLVSAAIMIGIGVGALGSHVMITWEILPFLFVGPFLFVSLGMLAGAITRTPESAAILGNIITFPMMFLSGTFFPVSSFPPFLQPVAHALPLYYVIDGLEAVMLFGNTTRALLDLAIVFVIAVVIFLAAVRFFQWREK